MNRTEAIKILRETHDKALSSVRTALETLIPELEESEDERIRKEIIAFLKHYHTGQGESVRYDDDWIVYLEKQKEQNFEDIEDEAVRKYMKLDKFALANMLAERDKTNAEVIETFEGIEEQPAEWSEDYREEDIQTRFAFYTYKDDPSVLYLSNVFVEETSRNHGFGTRILKAAEKAAEAIGAITICLKVKQDSPANAWYRKHGYGYMAFEGDYDWLEKTLEYLKPVKQEWSEEDEKTAYFINQFLEYHEASDPTAKSCKEWFNNRLKSLHPDSYKNCNSRWKPSEEQMDALMLAIEGKCAPTSYMSRRLEDLYEALVNEFHVECKLDK